MNKITKYFKFLFTDIADFLELSKFRWYRAYKGGNWYKHQMNGELPNCYGSFWATYGKINRYADIMKQENYCK